MTRVGYLSGLFAPLHYRKIMASYNILYCLLFTQFLLGSFHVVKSQSTTSEVIASVSDMASTTVASIFSSSTVGSGGSSLMPNSTSTASANQSVVILTSVSPTSFLNNNTSEDSPTNSSSSSTTTSRSLESTKQPIFSTALTGTTNFTVSTTSSQNDTNVTTMTSTASHNATTLSSTTIVAVNTGAAPASNDSSNTTASMSITTSPAITVTSSAVATSNNSASTVSSITSHDTVNGTATTRESNSSEATINTTHPASTSTAAAQSTSAAFTTGQNNNTTVVVATSTVTSNNTWFTAESVTVETVSATSSSSTVTRSTYTVSLSSTDAYSTEGNTQAGNTSPSSAANLGWIAAPVIVGILLIVAIVVIVLLVLRRRAKKQRTSKFLSLERRQKDQPGGIMNPSFRIDADDTERSPPPPVRVEDFVNHVAELRRDSDYGFASEFAALSKLSPQNSKSAAELPENRTKNRFTNILPFDHSRVKLIPADDDEDGGSDYINASFLPGFSSRREFIAAQGPMKSTLDDFWRMIWEYNVTTVVMVTNLFERGREKCVQYWPEQNEPIYYGDIQVELKSESSLNYYIIRVLNVTLEQRSRRVMHYQFLTWPDFGVPKEHGHLLSFLTQVRSGLHPTTNQPVLVHCSAGVGRTGTFILIDHVLQLIRRNSDIDLFGLVLDMRNYRSHMIQTEAQYIFAHECIKCAIELGYHQGRDIFTSSDGISTDETEQESLYMNSGQGSS